jgi:hypothetical protein
MDIWIFVGIFVILDLALITFVVVSKSKRKFPAADRGVFEAHLNRIKKLGGRDAVMEADKLLYEIMEKKGYKGSLGDKLKKAGPAFSNVNDVWAAHKLRNRLAHELGVGVSSEEALSALKKYERAYKDLGL